MWWKGGKERSMWAKKSLERKYSSREYLAESMRAVPSLLFDELDHPRKQKLRSSRKEGRGGKQSSGADSGSERMSRILLQLRLLTILLVVGLFAYELFVVESDQPLGKNTKIGQKDFQMIRSGEKTLKKLSRENFLWSRSSADAFEIPARETFGTRSNDTQPLGVNARRLNRIMEPEETTLSKTKRSEAHKERVGKKQKSVAHAMDELESKLPERSKKMDYKPKQIDESEEQGSEDHLDGSFLRERKSLVPSLKRASPAKSGIRHSFNESPISSSKESDMKGEGGSERNELPPSSPSKRSKHAKRDKASQRGAAGVANTPIQDEKSLRNRSTSSRARNKKGVTPKQIIREDDDGSFWNWFQESERREKSGSAEHITCTTMARLCESVFKILRHNKVRIFVDISCGKNVAWMPTVINHVSVELWGFKYVCIASDPVEVTELQRSLKGISADFEIVSLEWWRERLPENTDLVLAWDVLCHSAYGRVWNFFQNVKASGVKEVLVDNYPSVANEPSPSRKYVNLRKHPFKFPAAQKVIQNVTEPTDNLPRQLLLYTTDTLPSSH